MVSPEWSAQPLPAAYRSEAVAESWRPHPGVLLRIRQVAKARAGDPASFAARRELVQLLVQGMNVGRDDSGRVKVSVTYKFGPPPEDPDGDSVYGVSHSKESILQNARERLENSREEDAVIALGEIANIARLRLQDLVEADPGDDAERGGGRR